VTSGYGQMAHIRFTAEERRRHAQRPPSAAATGFGDPLPERLVRGIVFARLVNYVEGHAAISPELAEAVAGMLDEGRLPTVPSRGNGSAGEISALSYLFHDVACRRELKEKDALALINGSPCATAMIADSVLAARRRLDLAHEVFALSADAIRVPWEQLDAALEELWGEPYESRALSSLRTLVEGGEEMRRPYQAPVSWRILPRILGRALRAMDNAEDIARISLRAITDNPVFLPPDAWHPRGRVLSNGGFHNAQAPAGMDGLSAAYADLAVLADRHVSKLLDGKVSQLPHQLITTDGYLGCLGFTALAFAEDARNACQASLLPGSEGGGFGQNDVASPIFPAWQRHEQAAQALEATLACLAVIASQALFATNRCAPPRLEGLLSEIRRYVPPVEGSRMLGPEVESLAMGFRRRVMDKARERFSIDPVR
jgi:histidine ammonia-lyase